MTRCLRFPLFVLLLTLTTAAQVTKPDYIKSLGFFTLNGKIYNPDGSEFLMRGVSQPHYWGNETFNLNSISGIAKTHANIVRVVMSNAEWQNQSRTPDKKRALVERYIAAGLIPMVEQHDGTCVESEDILQFITDVWTDPQNVAWLNEYEEYVILNIANEWGPRGHTFADYAAWRDAYKRSIERLRDAGINNMLVIDAPDCGQGPRAMEVYGRELLEFDPQHNVVFSIHMYGMWRTLENAAEVGQPNKESSPWVAEWELQTMLDLGLPIIVGEFSWKESSSVGYDTKRLIAFCQQKGIGWLAWSWNGNSDPLLDMARGWKYDSDADLYPFGDLIINHPFYGLRATSTRSSVFGPPPQRPRVILNAGGTAELPAGSDIELTADASDPDGRITKIVFYNDEQKLGEAAAPPYTLTWKNVPRGRFRLRAAAWDNDGLIGVSPELEITVGRRPLSRRALLVVGDTQLRPGDAAVSERLRLLGHEVQAVKDAEAAADKAQAFDLVLISATCVPTRLKTALRDVPVPVLIWESLLFDDMSMTGNQLNIDYGRIDSAELEVIADHPAASGLNGRVTVYEPADRLTWAIPTEKAAVIAVAGSQKRPVLFVYRRGDQMIDRPAPAARAALFLQDDSAERLTIDGWRLFDGIVDYLVTAGNRVEEKEQPSTVALAQNYPNPFNPETTITFHLPQPASVLLAIYTLEGRTAALLTQGRLPSGTHQVVWNGRTDSGVEAASGVYFYRLYVREDNGAEHTLGGKMTLLR